MAKTLIDLYQETLGNEKLKEAFGKAAKAGKVLDFVKACGVDATQEDIDAFKVAEKPDEKLSVEELGAAAGGGSCGCDHDWKFKCYYSGTHCGFPWEEYHYVCSKCGKTYIKSTGSGNEGALDQLGIDDWLDKNIF